ncbi:hypothetical protein [Kitasatospora sp. NBC_01266]|uniref:hypothetical protein n=1 Tax=Kitasatospora sp. NBC_01266 TaxID=2903572 RepID=UPI002E33F661|nr:hypothetical protein [Kitasatospora sp. NBC_01266]
MTDGGSSGPGTAGGAGSGYQVEVDSLRAFAGQVRGLLAEFQQSADGSTTHARTGVGSTSFGEFAEATALYDQYGLMRDGLRDVLTMLQEAIDDAQRKADLTASNYENQEHETARSLQVSSDGWSVGAPLSASSVAGYGAAVAGVAAGAVAGRKAAGSAGPGAAGGGGAGGGVAGGAGAKDGVAKDGTAGQSDQPVDQSATVPTDGAGSGSSGLPTW